MAALNALTPAEIKTELDRYVVGQDYAKRTIATAVSAHYRLALYQGGVHIKKTNLLLMGPTGSGKTYIMQVIARMLDVPYAAVVATAITPAGWYGEKAESAVAYLYQKAKQRYGKDAFRKAEVGIVYIDEIDKLAARAQKTPGDETFNTVQVQQALLRVVESTDVILDGNPLSTSRILFVCSGAFVGLEQQVRTRLSGGRFVRSAPDPHVLRQLLPRDLVDFGFIPEFVGRFPVTTALDPLSEDELIRILRDIDDSLIQQWNARLSTTGSRIEVEESVLRTIARNAIAQGTGARGLDTALWKILEPVIYNIAPGSVMTIGREGIQDSRAVASAGEGIYASPLDFSSEPTASAADEGNGI